MRAIERQLATSVDGETVEISAGRHLRTIEVNASQRCGIIQIMPTAPQIIARLATQAELAGAGLIFAFGVLGFVALRRRVPLAIAYASLGLAGVGAVVGGRTYWVVTHDAWGRLLDLEAGFSSFGAVFGGGFALAFIRAAVLRPVPFRRVVDTLVPSGLIALAFARLGCLSNACDWGRRTELPWGIQYGAGTDVFRYHFQMGWVDGSNALSAAVHPLPIYLLFAGIGAVVVAGFIVGRPGASAGWAVLTYAGLRLPIEAFRSPAANGSVFGLPTTMVGATVVGAVAIGWLVHVYRPLPIDEVVE